MNACVRVNTLATWLHFQEHLKGELEIEIKPNELIPLVGN